jgi:hypothetical protein
MKYLYILLFTLILGGSLNAQSRFGTTNGVDQSQMGNQQYIQFDENTTKYFWAVDLNIFTATQKSNFQELVFNCETLVAVSTPDANNYWYLASFKTTDKEDVKIELNKMINKAKIIATNPQDKYQ